MIVAGGAILSCLLPDCIVDASPSDAQESKAKLNAPVTFSSAPSLERDAVMAANRAAYIAAAIAPSLPSIPLPAPAPAASSLSSIAATSSASATSVSSGWPSSSSSSSVSSSISSFFDDEASLSRSLAIGSSIATAMAPSITPVIGVPGTSVPQENRKRMRDDKTDSTINDGMSSSSSSHDNNDTKAAIGGGHATVNVSAPVTGANGFHTTDIDIFIVGLSAEEATTKMITILETIKRNGGGQGDILISPYSITILGHYPNRHCQVRSLRLFDPRHINPHHAICNNIYVIVDIDCIAMLSFDC